MMNLNLKELTNVSEADVACGANLPRATRKELLKIRISNLASSIISMTQNAFEQASQVGNEDQPPSNAGASPSPGKRQGNASRSKRRASPAMPVREPVGDVSGTKAKSATRRSPGHRRDTPKPAGNDDEGTAPHAKASRSHKKGGKSKNNTSPKPTADDCGPLLGPDGVSPTVEGASFEEVVRTLKALESPHGSQEERAARQLRWGSPSPDGSTPAPETTAGRITAATETQIRDTADQFQAWLDTATATTTSATSEDQLTALIAAGLLDDRALTLSLAGAVDASAETSATLVERPLTVQEVTESLHRLAGPSVDEEETDGNGAQAPVAKPVREARYYEVIYMLHREHDTTGASRAGSGLVGDVVEREKEEHDENEEARRRLEKLYAKSVFSCVPPPQPWQGSTHSALDVVAQPNMAESEVGDAADGNHAAAAAQEQYQVAIMDLLQSSTLEPVRITLRPLGSRRPFQHELTKGRCSTDASPESMSPPRRSLPTQPNSSETIPLVPSAERRTRESSYVAEQGGTNGPAALSRSFDTSEGFTRTRSDTANGGVDGDADGADGENASGANLAIRRIETWQRHREDVVASRIVNRRRSSVSGLAGPATDFYYTSSTMPSPGEELLGRDSGERPPISPSAAAAAAAAAGSTRPPLTSVGSASKTEGHDTEVHTTAASDSTYPTISTPSWTTSSGPTAAVTATTSQSGRPHPLARPHRRGSAAIQSVSSVTTNTATATSTAAPPSTLYDVLLSTAVHTSAASVTTGAGRNLTGSEPGADRAGAATNTTSVRPPLTPAPRVGALDVIVANDYLTTPHLQMIWQTSATPATAAAAAAAAASDSTSTEETPVNDSNAGDTAAGARRSSADTSGIELGASSLARQTSTYAPTPLGSPIVLC